MALQYILGKNRHANSPRGRRPPQPRAASSCCRSADPGPHMTTPRSMTPLSSRRLGDVGSARRRDVRFLLTVARALHTAGTTAQRLEDTLEVLAKGLGLTQAQFFS